MPLPTGNMGGVELQENIELEKIRDRKKIKVFGKQQEKQLNQIINQLM